MLKRDHSRQARLSVPAALSRERAARCRNPGVESMTGVMITLDLAGMSVDTAVRMVRETTAVRDGHADPDER